MSFSPISHASSGSTIPVPSEQRTSNAHRSSQQYLEHTTFCIRPVYLVLEAFNQTENNRRQSGKKAPTERRKSVLSVGMVFFVVHKSNVVSVVPHEQLWSARQQKKIIWISPSWSYRQKVAVWVESLRRRLALTQRTHRYCSGAQKMNKWNYLFWYGMRACVCVCESHFYREWNSMPAMCRFFGPRYRGKRTDKFKRLYEISLIYFVLAAGCACKAPAETPRNRRKQTRE